MCICKRSACLIQRQMWFLLSLLSVQLNNQNSPRCHTHSKLTVYGYSSTCPLWAPLVVLQIQDFLQLQYISPCIKVLTSLSYCLFLKYELFVPDSNTRHSCIGHTIGHNKFIVNILVGAIFGRKAVGRSRLQYLKQVAINTAADSYTAMKRMNLQQIQTESCQPIRRLRDKKKIQMLSLLLL